MSPSAGTRRRRCARRSTDGRPTPLGYVHPQRDFADIIVDFYRREGATDDAHLSCRLTIRPTLPYPGLRELVGSLQRAGLEPTGGPSRPIGAVPCRSWTSTADCPPEVGAEIEEVVVVLPPPRSRPATRPARHRPPSAGLRRAERGPRAGPAAHRLATSSALSTARSSCRLTPHGPGITSFRDLGVSDAVVEALSARGILAPFPIQSLVIADATAGRDVLAKSQTGSGQDPGVRDPDRRAPGPRRRRRRRRSCWFPPASSRSRWRRSSRRRRGQGTEVAARLRRHPRHASRPKRVERARTS